MKNRRALLILLLVGFVLIAITLMEVISFLPRPNRSSFRGTHAYQDVAAQMNFGPRLPDSKTHADTVAYINPELSKTG